MSIIKGYEKLLLRPEVLARETSYITVKTVVETEAKGIMIELYSWPTKAIVDKFYDWLVKIHSKGESLRPWVGVHNLAGNPDGILVSGYYIAPGNMVIVWRQTGTVPDCWRQEVKGSVKFYKPGTYTIRLVAGVEW